MKVPMVPGARAAAVLTGRLGLAALTSLTIATSAGATTFYQVSLTGHLVSGVKGDPSAGLAVGDTFTLTAKIPVDYVVFNWGGSGYDVLGSQITVTNDLGPIAAPLAEWQIDGGGYRWRAYDSNGDQPFFSSSITSGLYTEPPEPVDTVTTVIGGPRIIVKDGRVVAVQSLPLDDYSPVLTLGDDVSLGVQYYRQPGPTTAPLWVRSLDPLSPFKNTFFVTDESYYDEVRSTYLDGFTGVWDFATSTAGTPEPESWVLFMLGLGGAGTVLRRRLSSRLRTQSASTT